MAKVLVVDDSNFQRKWLIKSLVKMGHETIEACDGCEGLKQVQSQELDCVVTDLLMPNMNGLELLEQMKTNGLTVPAIVVTADIQKDTKAECMRMGAKAFLNKPFKHFELEEAVNNCLKDI